MRKRQRWRERQRHSQRQRNEHSEKETEERDRDILKDREINTVRKRQRLNQPVNLYCGFHIEAARTWEWVSWWRSVETFSCRRCHALCLQPPLCCVCCDCVSVVEGWTVDICILVYYINMVISLFPWEFLYDTSNICVHTKCLSKAVLKLMVKGKNNSK